MRNIDPEIFMDEIIARDHLTLITWIGIITSIADDQGRFSDNTALIRAKLFPYDLKVTVKHIDDVLAYLDKRHRITRYYAGTNGSGRKLIQIVNWWKYQKKSSWASASQYPAPDKWIDRIRMHVQGNKIDEVNWDKAGGYLAPIKKLPSVKSKKRLPSREVKVKVKVDGKGEGGVDKKTPLLSNRRSKNERRSAPLPAGFKNLQTVVNNGK